MDTAPDIAGSQTPEASSDAEPKPKKKLRRKPLWLLLPVSFEVISEEGVPEVEWKRKPAAYRLVKCNGKREVQEALTAAQMDITNTEHVLLLRADPTPLKLQSQVIIKW